MNLPPPPLDNDPIITQFKPVEGQWELTDDNVNRIDPETDETILHNYCKYINTTPLEVFKLLIETMGSGVNAQNNDKDTPLHLAFHGFDLYKCGDIAVLTYLFSQKGINGNITDRHGDTLLQRAFKRINQVPLEVFQSLIETVGCDVNVGGNNNNTLLHHALEHLNPHNGGDINVWAYLITQKGINVNIKNSNGHTLLHLACICEIPDLNNYMDSEDEFTDSDDDFADHREEKAESFLYQIVQAIAERCVQQVLDETMS
jgi:hypothetical protein